MRLVTCSPTGADTDWIEFFTIRPYIQVRCWVRPRLTRLIEKENTMFIQPKQPKESPGEPGSGGDF